jgi:hypothetical protein
MKETERKKGERKKGKKRERERERERRENSEEQISVFAFYGMLTSCLPFHLPTVNQSVSVEEDIRLWMQSAASQSSFGIYSHDVIEKLNFRVILNLPPFHAKCSHSETVDYPMEFLFPSFPPSPYWGVVRRSQSLFPQQISRDEHIKR